MYNVENGVFRKLIYRQQRAPIPSFLLLCRSACKKQTTTRHHPLARWQPHPLVEPTVGPDYQNHSQT